MTFSNEALQKARESGYSDDEIYSHLSASDPRFKTAHESGYTLDDVAAHFAQSRGVTATGGDHSDVSAGSTPAPATALGAVAGAIGQASRLGPEEPTKEDLSQLPPWDTRRIKAAESLSEMQALETEAQRRPLVDLPKPGDKSFGAVANIVTAGLSNLVPSSEGAGAGVASGIRAVEGMGTAENISMIPSAAVAGAAGLMRPVSAYFAATMGKEAVKSGKGAIDALAAGDLTKAGEELVTAGTMGLMATAAGGHAYGETRGAATVRARAESAATSEAGKLKQEASVTDQQRRTDAQLDAALSEAEKLAEPPTTTPPNAEQVTSPTQPDVNVLKPEGAPESGGQVPANESGVGVSARGQGPEVRTAEITREEASADGLKALETIQAKVGGTLDDAIKAQADARERYAKEDKAPSPLAGPALKPSEGEPLKGQIGEEHGQMKIDAAKHGEDFTEAEHGFHDKDGNFLSRTEGAQRALDTGLIDQAEFDRMMARDEPGMTSQDLKRITEAKAAEAPVKMVAAAYRTSDGRIITGIDHMDSDMKAREAGVSVDETMAGFVDANGRFYNREDAYKAAKGQIAPEEDTFLPGKLHTGKLTEPFREPPKGMSEGTGADLPVKERIRRVAEELGQERSTGKGLESSGLTTPAFGKALTGWVDAVKGMFEVGKSLKRFIGNRGQRDITAATFDAANNKAGYVARQARRHVELAGASKVGPGESALQQRAATFVRQANGDKAGMLAKLSAIKGKGFDDVIDYATKHWDELESISDAAKTMTDAAHIEADAAGVSLDYRDNYVKGAYDFPFENKVIFDEKGGGVGTGTSFKKPKVFNDYAEAIAAGFKPKELRLDMLTESAVGSTLRAVNRSKWATSLESITLPDGLKAVVPPTKAGTAPRGYRMVQVTPGRLLPIHEELAPTVEALTHPSQFPRILSQSAAFVKHNLLVLDIFHGSRFAQMQGAFERGIPSYHKGLALLEFSDADLGKAVSRGLISPAESAWASANRPKLEGMMDAGLNVGRISDALFADVTPLLPGAKRANKFIFDKLSRGVITQSAMTALERNRSIHPEMSEAELNRYTAKEMNTYFRNLGSQGIFKSKTWQDAARFFFLAPQWVEGMVRSEARGYGQMAKAPFTRKAGNIAQGMGTGLLAYAALTQVINLITRGKPTWENDEPGHKFDAWIPDVIQGSGGFFISPLSVFAEMTHDSIKYTERGMEPLDVTAQLAKNKASPAMHAFRDLAMGKDFFGRPLHGLERVAEAAQEVAPVPLFAKTGGYKGGAERQILSTFGIKATPAASPTNDVYALADKFKREQKIKIPDIREESDYAKLRRALQNGDLELAQEEYDALAKSKKPALIETYFKKYPTKPLTGSVATESKFRGTLDHGQMEIYNASKREREEVAKLFRSLRR